MRRVRMPGKAAHLLAKVLTLLLTLSLTALGLTWQVNRVLTQTELHESVALSSRVQQAQMQRIEEKVQVLSQQYFFQPETVMDLVDAQRLQQYNRDVIAWWMGLMGEDAVIDAPAWPTRDVEQAVREDEGFKANTPSDMRRVIARDKVAYQVGQAVRRSVLPVRADILSLLMPKVLEKIDVPVYVRYIVMLPAVFGGISVMLVLVLLALMRRRMSCAALYIGGALGASGLCGIGLCVLFSLLGISGMVGELSPLLAMQLDMLATKLYLQLGSHALLALMIGMGLIGVHQLDMLRLARRRRAA